MKKQQNKTIQINFNVGYNGDWYDGRTWSDGVPYMEGECTVTCNGVTKTEEYRSKEMSDIIWDAFHNTASFLTRGKNKIQQLAEDINEAYDNSIDAMMSGSLYAYHLNGMTIKVEDGKYSFEFQLMTDEEIEAFESLAPDEEDDDEDQEDD